MTKGWIAIHAGGAPKVMATKLEGSREYQVITPVFTTYEACSLYWFSHSPEKAWAIMEIAIGDVPKEAGEKP